MNTKTFKRNKVSREERNERIKEMQLTREGICSYTEVVGMKTVSELANELDVEFTDVMNTLHRLHSSNLNISEGKAFRNEDDKFDCALTSYEYDKVKEQIQKKKKFVPNIVRLNYTNDYKPFETKDYYNEIFNYLVDKRTGVVYLESIRHGDRVMTVMMNADGKPMTAKELGLEY